MKMAHLISSSAVDPGAPDHRSSHMIQQVHRVLKNDGYLVISTPNSVKLTNVMDMMRG